VKPRLGWLFAAVLWLHQVAIAYLSPLSSQDWAIANAPPWRSLSRFYHWVIVKSHVVHVIATPLIVVALPLGLAALVRARRPRAASDDTLLFAVTASVLWLAIPRYGLACSYRLAVALHVLGLTAAVWYVIWLRAIAARARGGEGIGRGAAIGLALAGAAIGSTTWQVSIATIAACAAIAQGAHGAGSRRWGGAAIGGLIAGTLVARWSEFAAVAGRIELLAGHFGSELQDFDTQIRDAAKIGAGAAAMWLVATAWWQWRDRPARPLGEHNVDVILRAIGLALTTVVIGVATAEFTSFQALAPGAAVTVIAAICIVHFAGAGPARFVIVGLALAIQAQVMIRSLAALVVAHRQFDQRVAALRQAPSGTIATVAPYPLDSGLWFFGEDFQTSALRDRAATTWFGLRAIVLAPARPEFQDVPRLVLHHEVAGDASGLPPFYSADLATARRQFTTAIRRRPGPARLIVDGITVQDRPGEPVLAAWTDGAAPAQWWTFASREPDREGQLRLIARGDGLADAADRAIAMWSFDLATGAGQALRRGDDGVHRLPVGHHKLSGIVACSAARCALLGVIAQR